MDRVAEQGNIPERHGATGCAAVIVSRCVADMSASSTIRHSTGAKRPPVRELLARAWEVAHHLLQRPPLTVRYARQLMTRELKRLMLDNLALGLALEGLAAGEFFISDKKR